LIAIIFLSTGLWLGRRFHQKNKEILPQTSYEIKDTVSIDAKNVEKLGISKRELEVLVLMGRGMSNQEIADALFVSQNTVKTHTSRIFEKLDVKNRTHAIIKAKSLSIITG
jgi:two-component system, NarL family, response regulator LiaR